MAKKQSTGAVMAEVGAGLAAAGAAAAAGYYFYASKDAKKHRRIAAKWATDARNRTVKQIRSLPEVDAATVAASIDTALSAYKNARSVNQEDLRRAANELKANWQKLVAEAQKGRKRVVSKAKTKTKKVVKKATKKVRAQVKKRATVRKTSKARRRK